jgi:plastocyanin
MAVSYGLHIAVVIGCISLFAWGCDGGEAEPAVGSRRAPSATTAGYRVVDVVNGGTISGAVRWVGALPPPIRIPVEHHAAECGTEQELAALAVSPRGGVAGTVVYLDGITEGRAFDSSEPRADVVFRGCGLEPHVAAVQVGTRLTFRNEDPFLHNVRATFATGGAPWVDVGLGELGATGEGVVSRVGVSTLVDDAGHPWVLGFVHAFDHPYFAVTDADGRFRITGVPPGQYTMRAWHEGVRLVSGGGGRPRFSAPLVLARPAVVTSGSDDTVDFQLDLAVVDAAGE